MAELAWVGDELVCSLSAVEKLESLHGDVHIAASAVTAVELVDDALDAVPALKLPGARVPGWMAVGTFYTGIGPDRRKVFAAIHHETPRGVRVRLSDGEFDELVVGAREPEALVAALRREQAPPSAPNR